MTVIQASIFKNTICNSVFFKRRKYCFVQIVPNNPLTDILKRVTINTTATTATNATTATKSQPNAADFPLQVGNSKKWDI